MDPQKKDENADVSTAAMEKAKTTWKYCKIIAILALICAIGLLAYVVFAPSSPKNMMGGKKKGWGSRGGCGCVAPQA